VGHAHTVASGDDGELTGLCGGHWWVPWFALQS
jgi:hypothetical protein